MKKFIKNISVLLTLLALSFFVLSCSSEHSPTVEPEDYLPVEGDGDYNGTISNGSRTLWISVWISAWDKTSNNGQTEKGSFFFTLFKSSEKTKANRIISALCEERSCFPFEINGSILRANTDDYNFEAISTAGGGESYTLTLTLKTSSGQDRYTGQLIRKAQ